MSRALATVTVLAAVVAMTACAAEKSSNPLSPTVAGPIPGVNITAPTPMQPSAGTQVPMDQQPLTLIVQNAATNGVRPLKYVFEVATDNQFTNKVFVRDGIDPGEGKTTLRLPDPLATGHTYYWHARAQDGANTGPFSNPVNFNVYTPIVLQAPTLAAPIGNVITSDLHPLFTMNNAPRSGPVGAIQYLIEIADSETFASKVAAWVVAEQPNQTSLLAPQDFTPGKQYFWHARAFDASSGTLGPFSTADVFRTPVPAAPAPPPVGGGGGAGAGGRCNGSPNDGINLSQATIWNSPQALATWCATASITSVQFTSNAFLVDFDRRTGANRWPESPFGDGGGGMIQYTLGMCQNIGGRWNCSAVVQFWYGRDLAASGPPSLVGTNWFYDPARWGPMRQPANGETVGLFVCAGNCRGTDGSMSAVKERSNIYMVQWRN